MNHLDLDFYLITICNDDFEKYTWYLQYFD